jgi:hypothetical protein
MEEKKFSKDTQPSKDKKPEKILLATKTCNVRFENAIVELVEGQPVDGLTSQELRTLKQNGFLK